MTTDDIFADLAAQLDFDEPEVEDFTKLNLFELGNELIKIDEQLQALGQSINPHTDAARELHSRRAAIVVAIHEKRGK